MAAAFAHSLAGAEHKVVSGGTEPADRVDPIVVEAMKEMGIDLSSLSPAKVSESDLADADYVISMGAGPKESVHQDTECAAVTGTSLIRRGLRFPW